MRVIDPSYTILTDLDRLPLVERIEACGRVCYKSEDKMTEGSAAGFVRRVLEHGHNSVAEMGVATLEIEVDLESTLGDFFACLPRFMHIDRLEKKRVLMTGSVRAWRELYLENPSVKLVKAALALLGRREPLLFDDIAPRTGWRDQAGVAARKLPLAEVEKLDAGLLARHRHVAVRFIVNRAVTHEIVRHRPCSFLQESQRYCRYSEDRFGNEVTFIRPMFFAEGSEEYRLWEEAMRRAEEIYLELLATSSPQAARTVLPNSCKTEIIVYANLLEWLHIFRLRCSQAAEPSMREVMVPLLADFKELFPRVFADLAVE
jgi:thymidylate synthase (FAD)